MAKKFKSFFTTIVTAADRFLKKDKPTEIVFRHLFDSVCFRKEVADRGTENEQGLLEWANTTEIIARQDDTVGDTTGFNLAVRPSHLPSVVQGTGITVTSAPGVDGETEYTVNSIPSPPVYGNWKEIGNYLSNDPNGEYGHVIMPPLPPGQAFYGGQGNPWNHNLMHRLSLQDGSGSGMVEIRGGCSIAFGYGFEKAEVVINLPQSIWPFSDIHFIGFNRDPVSGIVTPVSMRLTQNGVIRVVMEHSWVPHETNLFINLTYQTGT